MGKKDKKQKVIEDIRSIVCSTGQESLFGFEVNYKSLESLFSLFLEESGYIVHRPESNRGIENEKELVSFFYQQLDEYNQGMIRPSTHSTEGRDLKLAKLLVKNRMESLDCSKKAALIICTNMVEYLIKYEHYYNLSYKIKGFTVFNKLTIDWIFNKTNEIRANPQIYDIDSKFFNEEQRDTDILLEEYGLDYFRFEVKGD